MARQSENAGLSLAERLTTQFYHWERYGRGWQIFLEPVELEPPFRPFPGHYCATDIPDDGRRSGLLSSLVSGLRTLTTEATSPVPPLPEEEELEPDAAAEGSGLVEFEIILPGKFEASCRDFEAFLLSIASCRHPVSLEIIGTAEAVRFVVAVDDGDARHVEEQFVAHFPGALFRPEQATLLNAWQDADPCEALVVDFGLSREFMLPLATHPKLHLDPYVSLVGAMSHLDPGELAIFQVLFVPVHHPWSASILRAVSASDGKPFFDDALEFFKEAKSKISRPLFAAVIRIATGSDDEERTWDIARGLTGTLSQFSNSAGNELIPLANDSEELSYDVADHLGDLMSRRSRRSGMLLNVEELASLAHIPGREVECAKLARIVKKTKAAPATVLGHPLLLGTNIHNGRTTPVTLSADQRVRHMHVVGASGTGKSTFLLNLIIQDIESGQGLGVLDPHGDLIDEVLARIPASRHKDVILVDPSDDQYPIGFNILSAHSDLEKTLLASDLVGIFRRFSTSWGDQMGSVLGNAVLAFLESSQGGTLADLRRFLIEPDFRRSFCATVNDPHVAYYWKKEFPLLTGGKSQAPLLTRLDAFLRPKPIRYMVAQKANNLDFAHIMDTKKIFLAKLSQGLIGEENAFLLGSLIVSKFHQITLGRQAQSEASRTPFYLYCDEFGGYVTPSMGKLLSGARKYKLGLILSHQELRQLTDPEVASAVLANAHTRIAFRPGDADAKTLADSFSSFSPEDLKNLATGEAICKVGRADDDFNFTTAMPQPIDPKSAESKRTAIIQWTREHYATPREVVERLLAENQALEPSPTSKMPVTAPRKVISEPQTPAPVAGEFVSITNQQPPATNVPSVVEGEFTQPVPPTPAARKPRPMPPLVAELGKGGKEHKYLQQLISQWGNGMGYRATIEMPTPDGTGSVDVVLEKEGRKIACEISVTSTVEQELGNLRKCLAAGFADVFMIGTEAKTLTALRKAAEKEFDAKMLAKVRFVTPEELLTSSELLEEGEKKEQTVRGYKVKVHLKAVGDEEAEARRRAVGKVMMRGRGKEKR